MWREIGAAKTHVGIEDGPVAMEVDSASQPLVAPSLAVAKDIDNHFCRTRCFFQALSIS